MTMDLIIRYKQHSDSVEVFSPGPPPIYETRSLGPPWPEAMGKSLLLIVPGSQVISLYKQMPPLSAAQQLKALPYAVEDLLLEAPEDYHFIISAQEADGYIVAQAVLRADMQAWLAPFEQLSLSQLLMVPDYLLLPLEPTHLTIAIEDEHALVRIDAAQGFYCDLTLLATLIQSVLSQHENAASPEAIDIYTMTDLATPIKAALESLNVPLHYHPHIANYITLLANNFAQQPQIGNLLQATFTYRTVLSPIKKTWLLAGLISASAVVIFLCNGITSWAVLSHRSNTLDAQITAIYQSIYPQATSVVAPQARMEQTLHELESSPLTKGYLRLLATTAKTLSSQPAVIVQALQYQEGEMRLTVSAVNFGQLEQAVKDLSAQGLHVSQENATTQAAQVSAQLVIRRTGV